MITSLLLCLSIPAGAEGEAAKDLRPNDPRPNIVFAFADDWGRHASCYAKLEPGGVNDVIRTPNVDRVAADGVTFTNAFVSAPSCTPCRSSLISGRHFWQCGRASILRGAVWDGSLPSYPLMLEEAGYHIGYSYKVWGPGRPDDAPYGEKRTEYGTMRDPANRFSQAVTKAIAGGQSLEDARAEILALVRSRFVACLNDAAEAGKPVCYWFGPTNVHRKWIAGSGKALWGVDPDDLRGKLPPYLPDIPVVREDLADYLGEAMAFDAMLGEILDVLEGRGMAGNTLLAVSGDHGAPGFPDGKCNLYDFGSAVPLIVRWPDAAKGGRAVTDFVTLPDLSPTFLSAGGVDPPSDMTARSLLPILKGDGEGRVDASRDTAFIGRERHVDGARPGNLPYPQRAVRTDDFLYVRNFRPDRWPMGDPAGMGEGEQREALNANPDDPELADYRGLREDTFVAFADVDAGPTKAEIVTRRGEPAIAPHYDRMVAKRPGEELYDLRVDPHQQTNVADDPAYADDRKRLSERLMSVLRETGDPRVEDDGRFFETSPMTDLREIYPGMKNPPAKKPKAAAVK